MPEQKCCTRPTRAGAAIVVRTAERDGRARERYPECASEKNEEFVSVSRLPHVHPAKYTYRYEAMYFYLYLITHTNARAPRVGSCTRQLWPRTGQPHGQRHGAARRFPRHGARRRAVERPGGRAGGMLLNISRQSTRINADAMRPPSPVPGWVHSRTHTQSHSK
jgi:hypothetical protein